MWVTCGSHPHWFLGQWVKWVTGCNPIQTLVSTLYNNIKKYMRLHENAQVVVRVNINLCKPKKVTDMKEYCKRNAVWILFPENQIIIL